MYNPTNGTCIMYKYTGMPFIILVLSEKCPLIRNAMDRLWIKLLIQLNIFPLIPLLSNLVKGSWRQTISTAFSMSIKMAHTVFSFSKGALNFSS